MLARVRWGDTLVVARIDRLARSLAHNPAPWTRDALIRAVRRLVADGLAQPELLKAAPRRSKKAVAQDRRLVELVATIHNAADGEKPTLARIGRQLERQGIPTKTGARTWAPSSVKALLDRARDQGLLDSADGDP